MRDDEKEIVTKFFNEMIGEFAGTDNGHDFCLFDSDIDRLTAWYEYYINSK